MLSHFVDLRQIIKRWNSFSIIQFWNIQTKKLILHSLCAFTFTRLDRNFIHRSSGVSVTCFEDSLTHLNRRACRLCFYFRFTSFSHTLQHFQMNPKGPSNALLMNNLSISQVSDITLNGLGGMKCCRHVQLNISELNLLAPSLWRPL